jgi:hypothetical protein
MQLLPRGEVLPACKHLRTDTFYGVYVDPGGEGANTTRFDDTGGENGSDAGKQVE